MPAHAGAQALSMKSGAKTVFYKEIILFYKNKYFIENQHL
jgi:hypothetical protein